MCSVSFVRLDGKATTQLLVLYTTVYPVEESPPLPFTGPKQSLCSTGQVTEGTDRLVLPVFSFLASSSPVLFFTCP